MSTRYIPKTRRGYINLLLRTYKNKAFPVQRNLCNSNHVVDPINGKMYHCPVGLLIPDNKCPEGSLSTSQYAVKFPKGVEYHHLHRLQVLHDIRRCENFKREVKKIFKD